MVRRRYYGCVRALRRGDVLAYKLIDDEVRRGPGVQDEGLGCAPVSIV